MTGRPNTPPQHGERRCYLRGCRRPECLNAHYRYMSRLRLDQQSGKQRRLDGQRTARHVQKLIDLGWTQAQIARASHVAHRTIGAIQHGDYATVSINTARKVLAVPITPPPGDVQYVDATGTTRRIRALVAIGHTLISIAPQTGLREDPLRLIARGERTQVRLATAEAVKAAYHKLSRTPGTSVRARLMAQRHAWHGPLAWDDTTIDDPNAEPERDFDEVELKRDELAALRRAEVEHLARFGLSLDEIDKRVDLTRTYIRDIVRELHTGQRRDRTKAQQQLDTAA